MPKARPPHDSAAIPVTQDAIEFRAAVSDVKPLPHTSLPPGLAKMKTRPRARREPAAIDDLPLIDAGGERHAEPIDGRTTLAFQRSGVRAQVVRKLRRGLIPIEAELDLHGMSQAAAGDQLAAFLRDARDAGCRCVRIIHGKGYRSGARGAVLKTAVDLWLRRHLDVMAFSSARTLDGGTGAVYVLLRA